MKPRLVTRYMHPLLRKYQTVYIVKDSKTMDIDMDDIVEVAPDRFKSIKFRHTLYKKGDFFSTRDEALVYCWQKSSSNMTLDP